MEFASLKKLGWPPAACIAALCLAACSTPTPVETEKKAPPVAGPHVYVMGMALAPDGSRLYVSTGRGKMVFVIDTATNKPVTSFEVGQRPWGIALSADGKKPYSANGPSNDVSVVDLSTNTVSRKIRPVRAPGA